MWREVPPGVSSFYPPSQSSFILGLSLFSARVRDKASLPNAEAPQELIIQKTRVPPRMRRNSERGGGDRAQTRACVKVGRG